MPDPIKKKIKPTTYKAVSKISPKESINLDVSENGRILVEKADGTIGEWGSPIANSSVTREFRMYPTGILKESDRAYLSSLNDESVNKALASFTSNPGEVPVYGTTESDLFKALLAKRK